MVKIRPSDAERCSFLTSLTAVLSSCHQSHLHHFGFFSSAAVMITLISLCFWCISHVASEHFKLSCICNTSSSTLLPFKPVNKPACASVSCVHVLQCTVALSGFELPFLIGAVMCVVFFNCFVFIECSSAACITKPWSQMSGLGA